VPPKIEQVQAGRKLCTDSLGYGVGENHLSAVAGVGDPRGTIDVYADVVVAGQDRLADMKANPNAELMPIGPLMGSERSLRGSRGSHSIGWRSEDGEERVALCRNLNSCVSGEHRADESVVFAQQCRIAIAQLRQQARAALDITEEECEPSTRQVSCHQHSD
jgi:hypothetical protein